MDRQSDKLRCQLQANVVYRSDGTVRKHSLQKSRYIRYTKDGLDGNGQDQATEGIRRLVPQRPVVDDRSVRALRGESANWVPVGRQV
jgi:hypothetical protein